jgi:NAD+ synthase (glutamine-hydrolysing)
MSHYNVNASVPKTLIQHLVRWVANSGTFEEDASDTLLRVLDTVISPELVPPSANEELQSTEDRIGPYDLHDFTLFYLTRHGLRPSKIAFLAYHAWAEVTRGIWPADYPVDRRRAYSLAEIKDWMELFLQRFFTHQFKRSASPNGPKVTAGGSLSPRGDWRAPSDASARAWLEELRENVPTIG